MIDAQPISFPAEAEEYNAAVAVFAVPAAGVRDLLADDAFTLVEPAPGVAHLVITAIDFRQHDWGSFRVIGVGFTARPTHLPDAPRGLLLHQSPVDQRFSCEVGHRAQGVPTGVEEIEVRYRSEDVTFALATGGVPALALRVRRVTDERRAPRTGAWVYSSVDGVPHGALVEHTLGTGVVEPADVEVELGASPLALTLRDLGLPAGLAVCTWGEGLSATYHLARPLDEVMPARGPAPPPEVGTVRP